MTAGARMASGKRGACGHPAMDFLWQDRFRGSARPGAVIEVHYGKLLANNQATAREDFSMWSTKFFVPSAKTWEIRSSFLHQTRCHTLNMLGPGVWTRAANRTALSCKTPGSLRVGLDDPQSVHQEVTTQRPHLPQVLGPKGGHL